MPNYDDIIKQSQANVKSLNEKLNDLDELYLEIKGVKKTAEEIPVFFKDRFNEVIKLSDNYTNTLALAAKNYLDGNNTLFTAKLNELTTKIKEFQKEITRLAETNFTEMFKDLQKKFMDQTKGDISLELKKFDQKSKDFQANITELNAQIDRLAATDFLKLFKDLQIKFIDQTREDLLIELNKFDEKSKDLQTKTDELHTQIERLQKVDLDKHFEKHQKTLSDIFGAVNSTNGTLTTFIQTLTGIVQTLVKIQTDADSHHLETVKVLNNFSVETNRRLNDVDNNVSSNREVVERKLIALSEQNEFLKKEIQTNKVIQIVGFIIIIIFLFYATTTLK